MWTNRRGAGRKAVRERAQHPLKKTPVHRKTERTGLQRRNHQRHREFLRHSLASTYLTFRQVVRDAPPPYRCRARGTSGRPPTDPRDVVLFLLLRTLEGWSYDHTYDVLHTLPALREMLGMRGLPAASTVANLVDRIPASYWTSLLQITVLRLAKGRCNAAGDSTGVGTQDFQRWYNVRYGKGENRIFLKLHALVATRAQWPFFLSAEVTEGSRGDAPEVERLLALLPTDLELGNVALDKGYQSRRNAQLIEDRGGLPVMALKKNIVHAYAKLHSAEASPAFKRLVLRQRADPRAHRFRYHRRPVIEGLFGAFKGRFGARVRSRRRHTQRTEILARVVTWNLLGVVYHRV